MHPILSVALFVGLAITILFSPIFATLRMSLSRDNLSPVLSKLERLIRALLVALAGNLLSPSSSFPTDMMSKEDIFEELKSIRIMIEENPTVWESLDRLQELIWKVGEDIGEF